MARIEVSCNNELCIHNKDSECTKEGYIEIGVDGRDNPICRSLEEHDDLWIMEHRARHKILCDRAEAYRETEN